MENLERRSNTLETIGEKLKNARIERGLTIGDLQKITKIQRRYLEAIEENDFDAMPSDYYKRTFIRQFAEAVGLNPRPLLRRLDGKPEEEDLSSTTALSIPVKGSRKSKYNETNTKKSMIAAYVPVVLLVLLVGAIIGTIIFAIDNDDFMQATRVLLLNSFLKKSSKDYKKQLRLAEKLLDELKTDY